MPRHSDEDAMAASLAATKIQANFRGYRVRKRLKESMKEQIPKSSTVFDGERKPQRKERLGEEKDEEEEEEDEEEEHFAGTKKEDATEGSLEAKSATKIQAQVRGFLVRKRQQMARVAATKIQAGFRGFRTRKLLKRNEQ